MKIGPFVFLATLAGAAAALPAATFEPIRESCSISVGEKAGTLRLQTNHGDCGDHGRCGDNMSDVPSSRFTGFAVADFANPGTHLTATLAAEAGTFTCSGTVKGGELDGTSVFTPDAGFVARMEKMGFTGYDSEKLLAYALLDVQSGWARSLKEMGIHGIDADNLIALRVFHVDTDYVHGITALGYALPSADQLISPVCRA